MLPSAAYAHGGVGMVDNRCVLQIGKYIMFFTGYQPQNSRGEFCDDIPTPGLTVVALDMQETELRDMLTEIRIIRDEGTHTRMNGLPVLSPEELASKAVLDPVTINYIAAKEISEGNVDLSTYLPGEREIYRHRDGAERTRPRIRFPVPVCGARADWQKLSVLRDVGGRPYRRNLRSLALRQPEAQTRCCPKI
jgi:hypothetical protein